MLVALLETYLPGGWQLTPELLLNRMPLRVDIVILRRIGEPAGVPRKLHSIFDHLRPHTLIEHKGPTDDLEAEDVPALLAYAGQYTRLANVLEPADVGLMVVADHIPKGFLRQVKRHQGTYEEVSELWLENLPPEKRVRGRTPEQRLKGLTREEILKMLKALPPEEQAEIAKQLKH